ncbi:hypothetical protein PA25_16450 [Pseudoalteromonas sp. A25]|nr:hypothetical protein PA25_16450 [Pseudoalteromonas sp. A25]
MNLDTMFIFLAALVIYHHIGYSLILKLAKRLKKPSVRQASDTKTFPRIGVMICAYNEQDHISEKLNNLGAQLYPNDRYDIHVYLDGCTDNTEALAQQVKLTLNEQGVTCILHVDSVNKGKTHAVNALIDIAQAHYDILVFTDVSALISVDAFKKLAWQFENEQVAVITGKYTLDEQAPQNQQAYWRYQNQLKQLESNVGALTGVPGALFAIRADKVKPIPNNTINDDFVLASQSSLSGGQSILDDDIIIYERECDEECDDIKRRERIGAGNWQQAIMLAPLMNPKFGWASFNFLSHKVLRAVMPLVIASLYGISIAQMVLQQSIWAIIVCATLLTVHGIGISNSQHHSNGTIAKIHYALLSYWVALFGIIKYFLGKYKTPWQRVGIKKLRNNHVLLAKRIVDVAGAAFGLIMLMPLMLLTSLAIKLDTKGPILYKQLRVGKSTDEFVSLFYVYKFRSMVVDAESKSGAVWASKNDTRITKVGRFLRKTRIDELPQLWNVLIGEMSLIGPRPERPVFYGKLDKTIPYFGWRTYGLKPGISGLAQVMNGYDESIEDVKSKIGWDYAYVLSLSNRKSWLQMEWMILMRTIAVVFTGKGQ